MIVNRAIPQTEQVPFQANKIPTMQAKLAVIPDTEASRQAVFSQEELGFDDNSCTRKGDFALPFSSG